MECASSFPSRSDPNNQSVGLSKKKLENMGRGVSSGGGQSSLGYLFGSGEAPKPAANNTQAAPIPNEGRVVTNEPASKPTAPPPAPEPVDITKQIPAGIHSTSSNNYMRADGQNTGNFITDRPSTKVHSAPGGGSSLDYLFGGPGVVVVGIIQSKSALFQMHKPSDTDFLVMDKAAFP
ncbi:PREDICTED: SPIRAL1 [Prunus dulcis]|uniref:PREDICTED: SPIRAL1 n=1 Tax=Prunus dulcis TaxID=3755 RepID=A0A5E4FAQ2_PRUDU|nr:hypothetical protein L3X38_005728 [Prunus dulcis]VVA24139.1 PREDICTED: SPIRAL1 [Prunus dulcis]